MNKGILVPELLLSKHCHPNRVASGCTFPCGSVTPALSYQSSSPAHPCSQNGGLKEGMEKEEEDERVAGIMG